MKRIYGIKVYLFALFLSLTVLCVVMMKLNYSSETAFYTVHERQPLPKHVHSCRQNVLNQMTQGTWRKRENVTSEDEIQREEMDIKIRKFRGLPIVLHRDDMRCGVKFPSVGYSGVPSLCEVNSSAPCCNHDEGRCGSGKDYCSCHGCTDFRKKISAELFEYIPSSGCAFKNFTSKEACQLMNKRVSNFILFGDSLVRHMNNAMLVLFTNNPREGCLRKNLPENERKACQYDFQFVDSGKTECNGRTSKKIWELPEHKFCEGRYNFNYSFVEAYCMKYASWVHDAVRENLNKTNSVVAIGVGLHMNLVLEEVKKYMEPVLQLKKEANSEWPYIIWISIQAHGSLKPEQYLKTQHNDKIIRFNQQMKEYLEPQGIPMFDIYNLTVGVKSYDGTHYGSGVNMMKAQLLMNFLEEQFGQ